MTIKQDTIVAGGENRVQVNIIYQRKLELGPDLKKQVLEMLPKSSKDKEPEALRETEETVDQVYTANTMEEAIKFFVGTIEQAFGKDESNANEVTDFLLTTDESVSPYDGSMGGMFLFKYQPTTKIRKLKYYDRLPLIIHLGNTSEGMTGLNLHYLPPRYRVAFMKSLFGDQNLEDLKEDDIQSRVARTSSYKFVQPTYKSYKYEGIASRLVQIPMENWVTASLLPISDFQLMSRKDVWNDSIKKINKERRV